MIRKCLLFLLSFILLNQINIFSQDFNLVAKDSVMSGEYTFNNVSLTKNASITVAAYNATTKKGGTLVIKANTIVIEAGSYINASLKGGGGLSSVGWGGGAGHGGAGGASNAAASAGTIYGDSLENYVYMGTNGGNSEANGGKGGGSVSIFCITLVLHGKILADGGNGDNNGGYSSIGGGGASGGGILLNCKNLFFDGTISANGGQGGIGTYYGSPGGGGGGGRIKIFAVTKTISGAITAIGVWGQNNGQNGTIKFNSFPTSPYLIYPSNYASSNKPQFLIATTDADTWNNINYKIELSKDTFKTIYATYNQIYDPLGWSKLKYSTNDTALFIPQDVLPDGKYQWRAYAYDGSVWSDGWNLNSPVPATFNEFIVGATYVSLSSPLGGEKWQSGTVHQINWTSGKVTNVKIEYSTDAGTTWTTIIGSTPASSGRYYWVLPNINSTQCLVRVSSTANSIINSVPGDVFSILPSWQANLNVKDAGSSSTPISLLFGAAPDGTDGLDYQLGEAPLPPTPPTGILDARFDLPGAPGVSSAVDYRSGAVKTATWNLKFQPGTSGYPITISWEVASLPTGNFFLKDLVTGTIINIDMKTQNSYVLTNSGITSLKIEYTKETCSSYSYASGWGLYSVPVVTNNMAASAIFPQSNSPVYEFSNTSGYFAQSIVTPGKGYWVSMATANQQTLCGGAVLTSNIPVKSGWNIIGVYANSIPVSGITTQGTTVSSPFYSYNSGYISASTLQSGMGYWVKVSSDGNLVLPGAVGKGSAIAEIKYDNNWGKIIFTDKAKNSAVLYSASEGANVSNFEMPPLPPNGIFDVRFNSQKGVEVVNSLGKEITVTGGVYPIELKAEGFSFHVKDRVTNGGIIDRLVQNGSSVIITNPEIKQLIIQGSMTPAQFELMQNYPNPFNPKTRISFSIPERTKAEISVYNTLGEKVAEIMNEVKEAGFYSVDWNAEHFSSGIYFYQLKTEKQSIVKKLILMK